MFLKSLKEAVFEANLMLPRMGLVIFTWGNVSGVDRDKGLMIIKPSGIPYNELKIEHLVVMDLDGKKVEGEYNPSSDTPTHLVLYKSFPEIGGIVHTHSTWATVWAQAGRSIPCFGTTHADYFYGEIPCTRKLTNQEIQGEYEKETGNVIVETMNGKNPLYIPGALVQNHGPFSWGKTPGEAVHNAAVMEEVAKMAYGTLTLSSSASPVERELLDKHFLRKHGENAYYGQKKG